MYIYIIMYLYVCNVYMCAFTYVYIYIHAYGCMYVCVKHLKRCKLLPVAVAVHRFFIFHFFNTYGFCVFQTLVSCQVVSHSRGARKAHRAVPNEALYGVLRRPAKPRTGMSIISCFEGFSFLLHCCHNLHVSFNI